MAYHNRNKVLSYNASLNFIVLKRGKGKSWGYKDLGITRFKEGKGNFIWVRRYKDEVTDTKAKFFDDIRDKYPNDKLEVKGKTMYCNGKIMGYFVALSTVLSKKSVPYNDVSMLVFDEFIPETANTRYLSGECNTLSGFLVTVFRDRPVKAFLLGNKTSEVTPYNMYFNIANFASNKFYPDRKILIYSDEDNGEVEDNYKESDIVKVLKGTQYYDFAFKNDSLKDNSQFICKRPSECEQLFVIDIEGTSVGFYTDYKRSRIIADIKCDISTKRRFTFRTDNLKEGYFLFTKTMFYGKMLKEMIINARLFYADVRTKTICEELVTYLS